MLRTAAVIFISACVCAGGPAVLAQSPSSQTRTIDKAVDTNVSQALTQAKARKKNQQPARFDAAPNRTAAEKRVPTASGPIIAQEKNAAK